jgi:hypothetical protein
VHVPGYDRRRVYSSIVDVGAASTVLIKPSMLTISARIMASPNGVFAAWAY